MYFLYKKNSFNDEGTGLTIFMGNLLIRVSETKHLKRTKR